MSQLALTEIQYQPSAFEALARQTDAARYRAMAKEYHLACARRPFTNRCMLALALGTQFFDVTLDEMRQPQHRNRDMAVVRHKLMAFARIVSTTDKLPNPYERIGKVFWCTHRNVIYATRKYGHEIEVALGRSFP